MLSRKVDNKYPTDVGPYYGRTETSVLLFVIFFICFYFPVSITTTSPNITTLARPLLSILLILKRHLSVNTLTGDTVCKFDYHLQK
jgi:hypothetical protein